jgi:hypothetical protein
MIQYKQNKGHALFELAIIGSLLLVPLFLALPLLVKFAEVKQKNLQALRYVAWERTVWLEKAPFLSTSSASKDSAVLQAEIAQRIFSHHDTPLVSLSKAASATPVKLDPMLMVKSPNAASLQPLLDKGNNSAESELGFSQRELQNFASMVSKALAWPLKTMGFSPNQNGLVYATVETHILPIGWHPSFDPQTTGNTAYSANNYLAILTDSWSAANPEHTGRIIRSLLPAKKLGEVLDASDKAKAVADTVGVGLPWLKPMEGFELGLIKTDIVPEQRQTGLRK